MNASEARETATKIESQRDDSIMEHFGDSVSRMVSKCEEVIKSLSESGAYHGIVINSCLRECADLSDPSFFDDLVRLVKRDLQEKGFKVNIFPDDGIQIFW